MSRRMFPPRASSRIQAPSPQHPGPGAFATTTGIPVGDPAGATTTGVPPAPFAAARWTQLDKIPHVTDRARHRTGAVSCGSATLHCRAATIAREMRLKAASNTVSGNVLAGQAQYDPVTANGLRSRVRRFESCWGRFFEYLIG
jgi:hypothetical protein